MAAISKIYFLIDAFSFKIIAQVNKQIKNRKMQKSVFRECLVAGVAFSCGVVATSAVATSISQAVAQRPNVIVVAQSVDEGTKLKFESQGCRRTKPTEVICDVLITNIGNERQTMRFYTATNAVDTSGTVYAARIVQSGAGIAGASGSDFFNMSLASGVPTKVTFTFEIPQEVTKLAAIDVDYLWTVGYYQGRKVAIPNIGTIASNSASKPNPGNNCNCICPPRSTR